MNKFLKGKKTYISLAVLLVGFVGVAEYVSEAEVAGLIDAGFQILGIAGAVYGRIVAKPKE